jgi:uncharacterized membrane protein
VGRGRLEAFSDGVIAIIITIMVLELKAPQAATPRALLALSPVFLSYALSFLALAGFGFFLLRGAVARRADPASEPMHRRQQRKNLMSAGLHASAIPLAYVSVWLSFGIYLLIPALYFMPERQLESAP